MAIRPEIALGGRSPDFIQRFGAGAAVGEQIRDSGIRGKILQSQAQQMQQNQALQTATHTVNLLEGLKGLSLDKRAAVVAQQLPLLTEMGLNPQEVLAQDLTDQGIDQQLTALRPLVASASKQAGFQFGATQTVKKDDGSIVSVTQVRDPQTGTVRLVESPIQGELVSSVGETAEERKAREVGTAAEKQQAVGDIQVEQAVKEEEAVREAKVTTAQALSDVEASQKRREALSSRQIQRLDDAIESGLSAASSLPDINRGLELLKEINTGGLTAKAKAITDFFGTTSGDVGELNNILAENVLSGLAAFTGAISEGERAFIEKMQTSLAQGTGFNIAQLNRLRNIYQREVNNGLKAAKLSNDDFAVGIFEDAIKSDPQGFGTVTDEKKQSIRNFVDGL